VGAILAKQLESIRSQTSPTGYQLVDHRVAS
jgi:hypothetical protein